MEDTLPIRPSVCFEVQEIIGVSIGNGNMKNYQVQWAPTWVSGFHLVGCEHLIEEFLQQQSEKNQFMDDTTTTSVADTHDLQNDINENVSRDDGVSEFATLQQSTNEVTELTYVQHSEDKDINMQASMVVNNEHYFENQASNTCLYSNSSIDNVNVKVETNIETNVSNEEIYTSDMDASKRTNPNFEWVKVGNMYNNDDTQEDNSMHSTFLHKDPHADDDDSTVSVGGERQHRKPNLEFDHEFQNNVLEVKMREMSEVETESLSNENTINLAEHMSQPPSTNLKRHTRIRNDEKPFKCDVCSRQFTQRFHLQNHLRTHMNEKCYKCEVCGQQFNGCISLKEHMSKHTGKKLVECQVCSKKFQTGSFNRHMRTHTGEKPFQCEMCAYQSAYSSDLKRHIRTVHSKT